MLKHVENVLFETDVLKHIWPVMFLSSWLLRQVSYQNACAIADGAFGTCGFNTKNSGFSETTSGSFLIATSGFMTYFLVFCCFFAVLNIRSHSCHKSFRIFRPQGSIVPCLACRPFEPWRLTVAIDSAG